MTTIQWCVPLGYSVDISANVRDGSGIQRDSFAGAFARENIWCDVKWNCGQMKKLAHISFVISVCLEMDVLYGCI